MKVHRDHLLKLFWSDDRGNVAVEYGLMISMILLFLAGIAGLGGGVQSMYTAISNKVLLAINL